MTLPGSAWTPAGRFRVFPARRGGIGLSLLGAAWYNKTIYKQKHPRRARAVKDNKSGGAEAIFAIGKTYLR